jgi:hypothetical protein
MISIIDLTPVKVLGICEHYDGTPMKSGTLYNNRWKFRHLDKKHSYLKAIDVLLEPKNVDELLELTLPAAFYGKRDGVIHMYRRCFKNVDSLKRALRAIHGAEHMPHFDGREIAYRQAGEVLRILKQAHYDGHTRAAVLSYAGDSDVMCILRKCTSFGSAPLCGTIEVEETLFAFSREDAYERMVANAVWAMVVSHQPAVREFVSPVETPRAQHVREFVQNSHGVCVIRTRGELLGVQILPTSKIEASGVMVFVPTREYARKVAPLISHLGRQPVLNTAISLTTLWARDGSTHIYTEMDEITSHLNNAHTIYILGAHEFTLKRLALLLDDIRSKSKVLERLIFVGDNTMVPVPALGSDGVAVGAVFRSIIRYVSTSHICDMFTPDTKIEEEIWLTPSEMARVQQLQALQNSELRVHKFSGGTSNHQIVMIGVHDFCKQIWPTFMSMDNEAACGAQTSVVTGSARDAKWLLNEAAKYEQLKDKIVPPKRVNKEFRVGDKVSVVYDLDPEQATSSYVPLHREGLVSTITSLTIFDSADGHDLPESVKSGSRTLWRMGYTLNDDTRTKQMPRSFTNGRLRHADVQTSWSYAPVRNTHTAVLISRPDSEYASAKFELLYRALACTTSILYIVDASGGKGSDLLRMALSSRRKRASGIHCILSKKHELLSLESEKVEHTNKRLKR